jgi:hypothetical protein
VPQPLASGAPQTVVRSGTTPLGHAQCSTRPESSSAAASGSPPAGLRPLSAAVEDRLQEIEAAFERYRSAALAYPEGWWLEFQLLRRLKSSLQFQESRRG